MIRFGILGAARIAGAFALEKPANAELSAVASRDLEKARRFADEYRIPRVHGSYEALIEDPEIEAIYIPLPHHLHHEYTLKCARAGKHVLCEKPAALTVKEAESMAAICGKNKVLFMEAFMYRFLPVHQRVKLLVDEGAICRLMHIDFHFCIQVREMLQGTFRWDRKLGGGAVYDLGIYGIDLCRWMAGSGWETASALVYRENPKSIDAFSQVMLKTGGVIGSVTSSFITQAYYYTLSGEGGSIHVPGGTTGKPVPNLLSLKNKPDQQPVEEKFEPVNAYRKEAEYFAECIEKKRKPFLDLENCAANLRIVEEIFAKETKLEL